MMGKGNVGGAIFYVNKKVQFFDVYQNVQFDWAKYQNDNTVIYPKQKSTGYFGLNLFSVKSNAGNILRAMERRKKVKPYPIIIIKFC